MGVGSGDFRSLGDFGSLAGWGIQLEGRDTLGEPSSDQPAAAEPSFEQALERLQAIVQELEQGELGLDKALARYEEGVKLLRRCHDALQKAERKIELLSGVDAEGRPISEPLDDASVPLEEKAQQRDRRRSPPRSVSSPPERSEPDDQ